MSTYIPPTLQRDRVERAMSGSSVLAKVQAISRTNISLRYFFVALLFVIGFVTAAVVITVRGYQSIGYAADWSGLVCVDSDGGKVYEQFGSVSLNDRIYDDYCRSDEKVYEYYCATERRVKRVSHRCEHGCVDGVCSIPGTDGDPSDDVSDISSATTIVATIQSAADDVEMRLDNGKLDFGSDDLEFGYDSKPSRAQMIGLRFANVAVPNNATILAAYLEFLAEDSEDERADYVIGLEMVGDSPIFSNDRFTLQQRFADAPSVTWNEVSEWRKKQWYQSPDITSLVQELVRMNDWKTGNAVAFMIQGSGERSAYARDDDNTRAPRLVITYERAVGKETPEDNLEGGEPQAPAVKLITPIDGTQVTEYNSVQLQAFAEDVDGQVVYVDFYQDETFLGRSEGSAVKSFTLKEGWNFVSPVFVEMINRDISGLFPNSQEVYVYDGGYQPVTKFESGRGYWMNNTVTETIVLEGTALDSHQYSFDTPGTYLVGAPFDINLAGVACVDEVLHYNPISKVYYNSFIIARGDAAWVKINTACAIDVQNKKLYTYTYNAIPLGEYSFYAIAHDETGLMGQSDIAHMTVKPYETVNQIQNSDFETGSTTPWYAWQSPGATASMYTIPSGYESDYAAEVEMEGGIVGMAYDFMIMPFTTYELSFKARASRQLIFHSQVLATSVAIGTKYHMVGADWQTYTHTISNLGDQVESAQLRLYSLSNPTSTKVTLDDIELYNVQSQQPSSKPPIVGVEHEFVPGRTDMVKIRAISESENGIASMNIFVDGKVYANCIGVEMCSTIAHVYEPGMHSYYAQATDSVGLQARFPSTYENTFTSVFLPVHFNESINYDDVAVIVNTNSQESQEIAEYFKNARSIPEENIISVAVPEQEQISPAQFTDLRLQIETYLQDHDLVDQINYLVTTKGIPLKVGGTNCNSLTAACASVESELSLILGPYADSIGQQGRYANPYFVEHAPFARDEYGIYLVTRLDAYSVAEVLSLIDRSGPHQPTPKASRQFVFDQDPDWDNTSAGYLNAAMQSAANRLIARNYQVTLDSTTEYLTNQSSVLGYVSWGSNDHYDHLYTTNAIPHNQWESGAIADTYVSTSARTFTAPPVYGQSLIADLISEGISGANGYVYEPFASSMTAVEILVDRYTYGYFLAESYWAAKPHVSWMDVVIGDPKTFLDVEF